MDEIWKPIPGYEGLYEASNLGRIRSVDRVITQATRWGGSMSYRKEGCLIQPRISRNGYLLVNLANGKSYRTASVHRLVALTFHGVPVGERDQVAHGDGNKQNNCAANLRWATALENAEDRDRHGTTVRGEDHHSAKLKDDEVRDILASNDNHTTLARKYGVTVPAIRKVRNGKSWARFAA